MLSTRAGVPPNNIAHRYRSRPKTKVQKLILAHTVIRTNCSNGWIFNGTLAHSGHIVPAIIRGKDRYTQSHNCFDALDFQLKDLGGKLTYYQSLAGCLPVLISEHKK